MAYCGAAALFELSKNRCFGCGFFSPRFHRKLAASGSGLLPICGSITSAFYQRLLKNTYKSLI